MKKILKNYWWVIIILITGFIFYKINLTAIGTIFILSFILGLIRYKYLYYGYNFEEDRRYPKINSPWQWKFIEIWNSFVNFFLGGLIGYYFVSIRFNPLFHEGATLIISDFILFFIFALCLTGWLHYFLKNITEGITAIISRVLEK